MKIPPLAAFGKLRNQHGRLRISNLALLLHDNWISIQQHEGGWYLVWENRYFHPTIGPFPTALAVYQYLKAEELQCIAHLPRRIVMAKLEESKLACKLRKLQRKFNKLDDKMDKLHQQLEQLVERLREPAPTEKENEHVSPR